MNKKVAITGVSGFIGSNLAERLLKDGYAVIGVDDLSFGVKEQIPEGVDFRQLDIRSKELEKHFSDVDTVFHLAAKNSILDCQNDPVGTADINVVGTANVFLAASRAHVRKVVYAESSAVYEGSKTFPTPETDEHPESFYAASKMATKFFAQSFARYRGLSTVALRYFNVYGPRQDYRRTIPPLMSGIILKLLQGQLPVIYGDGSKRRDFIYIDDINDFHILAMNDDRANGQTYNLGGGKNYSVLEIFSLISELLDSQLQPQFKQDVEGEAQENLGDIRQAQQLGWTPKTDLREGVQKSIDYIREHVLPKL